MKTLVISPEDVLKSWNVIDEYLSNELEETPNPNRFRIKGDIEKIRYYLKTFNIKFEIQ